MRVVARTVQMLTPIGKGVDALIQEGEAGDLSKSLELMKSLSDVGVVAGADDERSMSVAQLTKTEGAGLRAFRQLLLDLDAGRTFAGLRRVLAPTGDFLWVCPEHVTNYDPGLPALPYSTEFNQ